MENRKRAVLANPRWDFVHHVVQKIADLPESTEEHTEAPKRQRKKKEKKEEWDDDDDAPYTVKKAAAKRSGGGGPKKPRKKKGAVEDVDEGVDKAAEGDEQVEMQVDQAEESSGPVFVDVSLAHSTQIAPAPAPIVDDDNFDV